MASANPLKPTAYLDSSVKPFDYIVIGAMHSDRYSQHWLTSVHSRRWRNCGSCRSKQAGTRFRRPTSADRIDTRLSENPDIQVLILEAGLLHGEDKKIDVPRKFTG